MSKENESTYTEKEVIELVKMLVVRGCFRGTESKPGRNYNIAVQTVKECTGLDYEELVE